MLVLFYFNGHNILGRAVRLTFSDGSLHRRATQYMQSRVTAGANRGSRSSQARALFARLSQPLGRPDAAVLLPS